MEDAPDAVLEEKILLASLDRLDECYGKTCFVEEAKYAYFQSSVLRIDAVAGYAMLRAVSTSAESWQAIRAYKTS